MNAQVVSKGKNSESFVVQTGVKQGCVLAPTLFALFLAAMLNEINGQAENRGFSIQYRMYSRLFKLCRFMTKCKTVTTKLRDLPFADDCALVAHSADDMQKIVNSFAKATISYGLQKDVKKTGMRVSAYPWYSKFWQGHLCEW